MKEDYNTAKNDMADIIESNFKIRKKSISNIARLYDDAMPSRNDEAARYNYRNTGKILILRRNDVMGIYVKAVKQSENEEAVVYSYGNNPDHLEGLIEFSTKDLSWKILKKSSERNGMVLAVAIVPKITRPYKESGVFPDVAFRQS